MNKDKLYGYVALAIIIFGTLYLLMSRAEAGTANLGWTAPTTKADGSPLTDLASYSVEWGTCSAGTFVGNPLGSKSVPVTPTSATIDNLAPGNFAFRVRAVRAVTSTVNAPPSAPSNTVCKTVPVDSVPPNPPVLNTVETVAYELRNNWFTGPRMVAVGSVALGEVCGTPWRRDASYARLTASQVTITSRYKGGRLFGSCA